MNKSGNTDQGQTVSLMDMFADMNPARMQELSSNLLQASQEAQGLITDMMMANASAPVPLQNPDPFGGMDVQTEIGTALARDSDKVNNAVTALFQGWMDLFQSMAGHTSLPFDRRFSDSEWSTNPAFEFVRRAWILNTQWLNQLIDMAADDLDEETQGKARFFIRQLADAMSPTNLLTTNPEALRLMLSSDGKSVLEGLRNARRDLRRGDGRMAVMQTDETAFRLGENIAATQGKVIFRNKLIEVIHYNPTGKKMYGRPVIIFPPWINKFYILDLKPENSFIGGLLSQQINTFVVSWRSADDETAHYGWDDYIEHGLMAALPAVMTASGSPDVNALGYCIGGTLLTTALAHMARIGDTRIHSATFLASQADFIQAGDLKIFTTPDALKHIAQIIDSHDGIMPGSIMGETFNWLRPVDLVWRYVIDNYLLGKKPRPFDLLYWNADQTNIPGSTHKTYLKALYQNNALSEGRFKVFGQAVSMADIKQPIYSQASRSDHICPWRSIYAGIQKYGGHVTFTLAGSGHIAGVINAPAARKYQHWTNPALPGDPDEWLGRAGEEPGSWWPHWWAWLVPLSGPLIDAVLPCDCGLGDAPGQYAAMRLDDIAAGRKPVGPYSDGTRPVAKR